MDDARSQILSRIPASGSKTVVIVGPTAVGKTAASLRIAQDLDAEIVSIDSRQVFREMTIGTAKPDPVELATVPHHLIDERSLSDPLTAVEYAALVNARLEEIRIRGRRALLVGGSTLYLHTVLFGLDDMPPPNPDVRSALASQLADSGLGALVDELSKRDPEAAESMDLQNPRRVLRALEVIRTTGRPYSGFKSGRKPDEYRPGFGPVFVLERDRQALYARIERRVDRMLAEGLVEEVRQILDSGHSPSLPSLQTIGYREMISHVREEADLDECVALMKRNTRRYAKRQLTWFRRYPQFHWVSLPDESVVN